MTAEALIRPIGFVLGGGGSLGAISPLDFTHTEALTGEAYSAARLFLEKVKVDGPGLYGSPAG